MYSGLLRQSYLYSLICLRCYLAVNSSRKITWRTLHTVFVKTCTLSWNILSLKMYTINPSWYDLQIRDKILLKTMDRKRPSDCIRTQGHILLLKMSVKRKPKRSYSPNWWMKSVSFVTRSIFYIHSLDNGHEQIIFNWTIPHWSIHCVGGDIL